MLPDCAVSANAEGFLAKLLPRRPSATRVRCPILEKALGPEHPNVAKSLENCARLLRKMSRGSEAVQMEARAKTIREKATK